MKYIIYITILLMSVICYGCGSVKYVPVESVKTEIEYKDRIERDSIHIKDSVFVLIKGDTVLIEKYKDRWRDRFVHDTAYIHKVDSIQVPFPIEKKLSRWQSFKVEIGGIAIGAIIILLVIVGWLILKTRIK